MEISYLGHSSFRIKGKNATLVTDPYSPAFLGIKFPKVEADIVTVSHNHQDHNFYQGVGGEPFLISRAGEYEVKGVSVFGFPSFHDAQEGKERGENNIYVIEIDGMRICHLGDLGSALSTKTLEEINGVDVLMVPVGGTYTLGPAEAAEVIGQIEPLIVLPMHFLAPGIQKGSVSDLLPLEEFLKKVGVTSPEKLEKLSLTKDKLPQETKVMILEKKD